MPSTGRAWCLDYPTVPTTSSTNSCPSSSRDASSSAPGRCWTPPGRWRPWTSLPRPSCTSQNARRTSIRLILWCIRAPGRFRTTSIGTARWATTFVDCRGMSGRGSCSASVLRGCGKTRSSPSWTSSARSPRSRYSFRPPAARCLIPPQRIWTPTCPINWSCWPATRAILWHATTTTNCPATRVPAYPTSLRWCCTPGRIRAGFG